MTRRVLVLLLPDVHLLDLAGPVQAFHEASELGGDYTLLHCGPSPRVRSAQGLVLADLAPLPEPTAGDVVLVPGMDSSTLDRLDHVPVAWLRRAAAAGARLASICSGAFALGRAGLLDGRACTTHWKLADRLRREFPRAQVFENRLFVEDGMVVTSAGVASGIDMALALIERDFGPVVVANVAREMVVWIRRRGDRDQVSVYLDHRTHVHSGVHRVQDFLIAHPERNPSLTELARIAKTSPRNLTRVFRAATGVTLKEFAHKVKLQVATELMANPDLTVDAVASSCGFKDARHLRRIFKASFGVAPAAWRDRRRA
jgi:transcriptional regulator GlxA family with amidase domain